VPAIFLSYRRGDTAPVTARLADDLAGRFGRDQLFLDVETLAPGEDFARGLEHALRAAAVVLIVIGPDWLDVRLPDGTRRLDDPADFVRREVEAALASGVPVIPLLVDGARMPARTALPAALVPLADRQACELRASRWPADAERLLRLLEERHGLEARPATPVAREQRGTVLAAIRALPSDLLMLLVTPKRQLARRTHGAPSDALRAVTFLVVTALAGDLLVLLLWPSGPALILLAAGQVVLGTLVLVLAPLMCAAWRLVGAPADYRRIAIVLVYQVAVFALGFKLVGAVVLTGLTLRDPRLLTRLLARYYESGMSAAFVEASAAASAPGFDTVAHLLRVLQVGIVAWLIASWGAYRQALGLGRLRSLAAFALFVGLAVVPAVLLRTPR
jgi:hypothetical protein